MKKQLYVMMVCGVAACAVAMPAAVAGVTFTNLNGAASWVWVEAENYSATSGSFKADWYANPSTDVSGWATGGRKNAMKCEGGAAGSYFVNTVSVPVAMSNAQLYVHVYGGDWLSVGVYSGTGTGGYSFGNLSGTNKVLTWATKSNLGALAAGDTTLSLVTKMNSQFTRVDGYFLASQAINTAALATVQNGTYWWMQAPTFSGTLPTLPGIAFTPTVAGAPVGATYWLNGVQQAGGFGAISASGTYNLVVKDSLGDVLAGTSFVYAIPEPASLGLLVLGGLLVARRRR